MAVKTISKVKNQLQSIKYRVSFLQYTGISFLKNHTENDFFKLQSINPNQTDLGIILVIY